VCVQTYVDHIGAVLRADSTLEPREAGMSVPYEGKRRISVNGNDPPER
jgi:hypothetical protein